jgi:hypothetical protein
MIPFRDEPLGGGRAAALALTPVRGSGSGIDLRESFPVDDLQDDLRFVAQECCARGR